jgi:nucleotide-binding universal stress UspA family protein
MYLVGPIVLRILGGGDRALHTSRGQRWVSLPMVEPPAASHAASTPKAERSTQMSIPATAPRRPDTAHVEAPVIVVGYDGSEESRIALAVAADRAGPEGTVIPVHVTVAASKWLGASSYEAAVADAYQAAEARLAEIGEIDTGSASVEPELIEGDPAEALMRVAQSRDAREIVVGSRGLGRFRAILGSVSHELLQRADRPVVIVPKGAVDVHH